MLMWYYILIRNLTFVTMSYNHGIKKGSTINSLIYRGYEVLDNKKSYGVYGDNDELIRIFFKDEATIEDVYKHIDLMRKEESA